MPAVQPLSVRFHALRLCAGFFPLAASAVAIGLGIVANAAASDPIASENGLVARYDFDDGDGAVLHDRSGHGFDGAIQGGAKWAAGIKGSALEFNGIDAYVQLPADSAFLLASFTVAAWIQPTDQGPGTVERDIYSNLVSTTPGLLTQGSLLRFRNSQLEGVSAGAEFNGHWSDMMRPVSLADGAWHWVAFSVSQGIGTLWVDGNMAGAPQPWAAIPQPTSLPQIGACLRNWASKGFFRGRIDEMSIYDRGLDASEMAAAYALLADKVKPPQTGGLIAQYDFDEGEGAILHDRSGNGFDGAIHGETAWKAGARGSSLEFNGKDTYVQLPSDSAFNPPAFTVAAWIQPYEQGIGNDQRVIYSNLIYTIGDSVDQGTEFRFRFGELEGVTGRKVYNGAYWSEIFRPVSLADGAWHMVALTVSDGYGRMWIDGVQAGAAETWGEIGYPPPLPQIGACMRNQSTPGWFHGRIDEMSIYGRALGAAEIAAEYKRIPSRPPVLNLGMGKFFGKPGDSVWVPLRLANLSSATLSACQFVLRVDSTVARFAGIKTDSGLARDWALKGWNDARKDSIPVALGGAPVALGKSEGELLRFGFVIPAEAPLGAFTDVNLEGIRLDDKGELVATLVPGRITVSAPRSLPGDVNGDGKVDIFDAQAILDYVVGFRPGTDSAKFDPALADVSGTGGISSYDAALVFQYAIGLIGSFPMEKGLGKRAAASPVTGAALTINPPSAAGTAGDYVYSLSGSGLVGLTAAEFRFQLPATVTQVGQIHSSWFSDRVVSHFDPVSHVLSVATVGEVPLVGDATGLLRITAMADSATAPGPITLLSAYLNEGRLTGDGFVSAPLQVDPTPVIHHRAAVPAGARLSGNRIQFANLAGKPARLQAFDGRGQRLWSQSWDRAPAVFDLPERGWPRGLIWIRLSAPDGDKAWLHLSLGSR
ncbi:MAG: hypothetical protein JF616_13170 [Fibrobacteres bacterium]|nr:hypothetical protein [Fibrobacterota bacterium]